MRITLAFALFAVLPLDASGAEWRSTDDSVFSFSVAIEGVATAGEFHQFDVALDLDAANPGDGELVVRVDLRQADLGDPDMNAVLFDPAWLDVGQFREAVFRSEEIISRAAGEYLANGTLDLKGNLRPVSVPFHWEAVGGDGRMSAQLVLARTDFEVGSGEWASDDVIGIEVTLTFDIRLHGSD
jgi:polyisoprenoid-binding protein YceI